MEFSYFKVIDFPKHQKRERILPWIRFGIFNLKDQSNILYPVGLIDSGSDITIIDYEFGEKLGIGIKKELKIKFMVLKEGISRFGFPRWDYQSMMGVRKNQ